MLVSFQMPLQKSMVVLLDASGTFSEVCEVGIIPQESLNG